MRKSYRRKYNVGFTPLEVLGRKIYTKFFCMRNYGDIAPKMCSTIYTNAGDKRLLTGFTLLETMVALAVLMAALVGPVSLITRGIFDFSFTKNKVIAINLAQEGIELIRVVRENNIICDFLNGPGVAREWNRDPDGGQLSHTTREVSVSSNVTIACGTENLVTPRLPLSTGQKIKFDPSTGLYGYNGQDTIFSRNIRIESPPTAPDSGIPPNDQMDVIATVDWNERGITRNMVLKERLYNWR